MEIPGKFPHGNAWKWKSSIPTQNRNILERVNMYLAMKIKTYNKECLFILIDNYVIY